MPFTPTHIVAVLPLRRFLPFGPLVIGSMVPDVPLFFPVVDCAQTHSLSGIFTTCLPLGVVWFLLCETVMRGPMVALLPIGVQRRIPTAPQIPSGPRLANHLAFYAATAIAIVIGALTHQVWDAFTHQDRWGTQWIPLLNSAFSISRFSLPIYKILQYGSTLIGLPLLVLLVVLALNRMEPRDDRMPIVSAKYKWFVWTSIFVIPLAIAIYSFTTQPSAYRALGLTIRRSGAALTLLCVTYCVLVQFRTLMNPGPHWRDN